MRAATTSWITGCSSRAGRRRYKRRNRIEIVFIRLKDWREVATRYDRCAKVFLSAVALAAHPNIFRVRQKDVWLPSHTYELEYTRILTPLTRD